MGFTYSRLEEGSNISQFDCGEEALNLFLKTHAAIFQKRHFGITVIIYESQDPKCIVRAYYTLCPAQIERGRLPEKFMKGPQPNPLPAFRLCRLAVDKSYQGKKLGEAVLMHALKRCHELAMTIGGTAVIVDAKNEKAAQFYMRYGFKTLLSLPSSLIITMKEISKIIA
jgi:GNAT superfamily N-acetyltransferase